MYHEARFESWWESNRVWYEAKGIEKEDFEDFSFKGGMNKGDIIFVWGRSGYELGDVIIFIPNQESLAQNPLIHRVVSEDPIGTKGDHNSDQLSLNNNVLRTDETNIPEANIIGKSVFRIPVVGWLKLIFFEPLREKGQRGFCK
jgi:hypothetical protein